MTKSNSKLNKKNMNKLNYKNDQTLQNYSEF